MDKWTDYLENGGQIDVIYADLEKAFNKVPHISLINKLKRYKINSNIIKWIESFLTDRPQSVLSILDHL
jgi:Reverse transcriptase (RNA-dependent DNA polymerase)